MLRFFFLALLSLSGLAGCGSGQPDFLVVGMLERDRIELLAEASEPVTQWQAQEGEPVTAGQPLLQLDPERHQARLNEARAARDRAAAALAEAEKGPRPERIDEMAARYAGAKQVAERRRAEYQRRAELLARKQISPDAVDQARAALDAAEAERDAAAAALRELRAGTRQEQIEQARQALAQAEAAAARAEVDLGRLTIRSPVAGRLDSLPLKPGTQPQSGAVAAVLLAGPPYARVYVPETIRIRVRPGDPARIRVDGIEKPYEGRVRTVAAESVFTPFYALSERDRKRLSYVAKIDFTAPVPDLPSGIPVQVELPNAAKPESP